MQSVAVLRRHQLFWRDPPASPFAWRGLLPLLALVLLALIGVGPFARGSIESAVQREIREQLNRAGFRWVDVAVSGQNVTLSGEEPAPGAGERAIETARSADCPTWSGRRTCAMSVLGRFTAPAPLTPAAAASRRATAETCERSLASATGGAQIEFASGTAAIETRSAPLLDALALAARSCPGLIRIEGHTDIIGRTAFNRSLSEARAAAVRDALIARGVPAGRLRAEGLGATRPIADNRTADGRARNRRIEFHAVSAD
jgi:outer membrane protein OmpA-like peptidoglycan-associated protein